MPVQPVDNNLELSIFEPDGNPARGRAIAGLPDKGWLMLKNGQFAGRKFRVRLSVCPTPMCHCCAVRWTSKEVALDGPDPESDDIYSFWLDVFHCRVSEDPDGLMSSKDRELAKAVSAELAPGDWDKLFRAYRLWKMEVTHSTPLEKHDVEKLPRIRPGEMVAFPEVFFWGHTLDFPFQDGLWTVEEHYCVQFECKCTEMRLEFLQYHDPAGRRFSRAAQFGVRYDYKSHAVSDTGKWPAAAPPWKEFMSALRMAQPSMDARLESRHMLLKGLYVQRALKENEAQRPARAASPKVGRNERCPCGSGKKFKHCCLLKQG